jgi:hypothetical protein
MSHYFLDSLCKHTWYCRILQSVFFCHSSSRAQSSVSTSAGLLYTPWLLWRQPQFSCMCMPAEYIYSWILVISVMVMLVCGVCYFVSWYVRRTSYQPLHVLCTGVKRGTSCKVTRIVLVSFEKFLSVDESIPPIGSLAVLWINYCVNCVCTGHFFCVIHTLCMGMKYMSELNYSWHQPFCAVKAPLCILCMESSFSISYFVYSGVIWLSY